VGPPANRVRSEPVRVNISLMFRLDHAMMMEEKRAAARYNSARRQPIDVSTDPTALPAARRATARR
jgi:hypothetical protein